MKRLKTLLMVLCSLGSVRGCPSCEGEGSTCKLVSGLFTKGKLSSGYNHMTTIPVGACSINITLIRPSSNRLGLGVTGESNFLNPVGNSTSTGLYRAAGTSFYYYRGDSRSREQILGDGPLKQSLNLQLFVVEVNRGVEYRYMFPMDKARDVMRGKSRGRHHQTARGARYSWTLKTLTVCSRSCGGGYQTTVAVCIRSNIGKVVPDSRCSNTNKPIAQIVRCNRSPCPPTWTPTPWGPCSVSCGQGIEERKVLCQQEFSKSMRITVSSSACGGEPEVVTARKCSALPCTLEPRVQMLATQPQTDRTNNFSVRSTGTPPGSSGMRPPTSPTGLRSSDLYHSNRQTSIVQVSTDLRNSFSKASTNQEQMESNIARDLRTSLSTNRGKSVSVDSVVSDKLFVTGTDAAMSGTDSVGPGTGSLLSGTVSTVPGTEWIAQPWGQCSVSCGPGIKERRVHCVDTRGGLVPDSRCQKLSRPDSEGYCDPGPCLRDQWFYSTWDTCTAHCGRGEQHRHVYCIGECRVEDRPAQTRKCRAPRDCTGEWFTGRWSVCSKSCGEGKQSRDVLCTVKEDDPESTSVHRIVSSDLCKHRRRPRQHRKCEMQACRPQWLTTDWSQCSVGCGEGVSTRSVVCLDQDSISSRCRLNKPENSKQCKSECKEGELEKEEQEMEEEEEDGWEEYDQILDEPELRDVESMQPDHSHNKTRGSPAATTTTPVETKILSNEVISSKPVKPVKGAACTDKFKNCNIVVQSRLCNYSFYQTNCCRSCTLIIP